MKPNWPWLFVLILVVCPLLTIMFGMHVDEYKKLSYEHRMRVMQNEIAQGILGGVIVDVIMFLLLKTCNML